MDEAKYTFGLIIYRNIQIEEEFSFFSVDHIREKTFINMQLFATHFKD